MRAKKKGRRPSTSQSQERDLMLPSVGPGCSVNGTMIFQSGSTHFAPATRGGWTGLPATQEQYGAAAMENIFGESFDLAQSQPQVGDRSGTGFDHSNSAPGTTPTDLGVDFDFESVNEQSSASPESFQKQPHFLAMDCSAAPPANPSAVSREDAESRTNSQCVLACCSIAATLENFIEAKIKMIDLALDVVRKAVTSLSQIIEQGPKSERCYKLLVVAVDQIVFIIERGCSTFLSQANDEAPADDSSFKSIGGILAGTGFGSFALDAPEKRAWHARVVLKDIRQISEIWKRIQTLQAPHGPSATFHGIAWDNHCTLTTRLEELKLHLERIQNL